MDEKILKFDNTEFEEYESHQYESPISVNKIDINKILGSNKLHFCKQDFDCFIGYKDTEKIRTLCILRSKMSAYKRDFDETKCMYFLIKDKTFF